MIRTLILLSLIVGGCSDHPVGPLVDDAPRYRRIARIPAPADPADLDGDGCVTLYDVEILYRARAWGSMDGDGTITDTDISRLIGEIDYACIVTGRTIR